MAERTLETFGRVRAIDVKARTVEVIASTGEIAEDDAIIDPMGWDLERYSANPVVLWSHDAFAPPIARAINTEKTTDALLQTHEFFDDDDSDRIFKRVQQGFINAVSVRWRPGLTELRKMPTRTNPHRQVLVFTQGHRLMETSYVSIPSDSGALVLRADDGSTLTPEQFGHGVVEDNRAKRLRHFADSLRVN